MCYLPTIWESPPFKEFQGIEAPLLVHGMRSESGSYIQSRTNMYVQKNKGYRHTHTHKDSTININIYIYMYLFRTIYLYLHVHLHLHLDIDLDLYVYLYVCMCIYIYVDIDATGPLEARRISSPFMSHSQCFLNNVQTRMPHSSIAAGRCF